MVCDIVRLSVSGLDRKIHIDISDRSNEIGTSKWKIPDIHTRITNSVAINLISTASVDKVCGHTSLGLIMPIAAAVSSAQVILTIIAYVYSLMRVLMFHACIIWW